jgi:hypothetical protein
VRISAAKRLRDAAEADARGLGLDHVGVERLPATRKAQFEQPEPA